MTNNERTQKGHNLLATLDDATVNLEFCNDVLCCMHDALETTRADILQGAVMLVRTNIGAECERLAALHQELRAYIALVGKKE